MSACGPRCPKATIEFPRVVWFAYGALPIDPPPVGAEQKRLFREMGGVPWWTVSDGKGGLRQLREAGQ